MNVTLIILTKIVLIIKMQLSDSKFEFAGEWLVGIGWVMNSLL